jgi:hypothetical protein
VIDKVKNPRSDSAPDLPFPVNISSAVIFAKVVHYKFNSCPCIILLG